MQYEIESERTEYDINNNKTTPITKPNSIEIIERKEETFKNIKMGILDDYMQQVEQLKLEKNKLPIKHCEVSADTKIQMLVHFLSFWNNLQQTEIKNAKKITGLKATMRKYLLSVYSYVLSYVNNYTMNFSIIFNNSLCDINIIEKRDQAQDIYFMYLYHNKFGPTKLQDVYLEIQDQPLNEIKIVNPLLFRMFLFQIDSVILTQFKTLELFAQAIKYNSSIYQCSNNNNLQFIEKHLDECAHELIGTDQVEKLQIDKQQEEIESEQQEEGNVSFDNNNLNENQESVE
jgi:hypothetical protein